MTVIVTRHAKQRLKQRGGIKPSRQKKEAQDAYNKGLVQKDVSGSVKRYLGSLFAGYSPAFLKGQRVRIYKNLVWIFKGDNLVTVQKLPRRYHHYIAEVTNSR